MASTKPANPSSIAPQQKQWWQDKELWDAFYREARDVMSGGGGSFRHTETTSCSRHHIEEGDVLYHFIATGHLKDNAHYLNRYDDGDYVSFFLWRNSGKYYVYYGRSTSAERIVDRMNWWLRHRGYDYQITHRN
jgi:hypothetical protein